MSPPLCLAVVRWRTSKPMPLESIVGTASTSRIILLWDCRSSSVMVELKRSSAWPMPRRPVSLTISTPSCVLVSISKACLPAPSRSKDTWALSLTPLNPFVRVRAHVRESSVKKQGIGPAGSSPGFRDGELKLSSQGQKSILDLSALSCTLLAEQEVSQRARALARFVAEFLPDEAISVYTLAGA